MRKRMVMLFDVWLRTLGWNIIACIVGSLIYFLILSLLTPSQYNFGIIVVFGLPGGLVFGILAGLVNGFILGALMAMGGFQPTTSTAERWLLYGISTLVTAICVGFGMSFINKYIVLPTGIAALIGWWVARRVVGRTVGIA